MQCTTRPAARRRLLPSPEIDGVGDDPTKAFSGVAGRFPEAAIDIVTWQSDGVSFSRWPPLQWIAIDARARRPSVKLGSDARPPWAPTLPLQ
jgi:hypothetical protein